MAGAGPSFFAQAVRRRWIHGLALATALIVAVPICAIEAAYRIGLRGIPLPEPPAELLPNQVAAVLSLELTGSPVPRLDGVWPWTVAGSIVRLVLSPPRRVGEMPGRRVAYLNGIAYDAVQASGKKGFSPQRASAVGMWLTRHWTAEQALSAWAHRHGLRDRAFELYGKEPASLRPAELAAVVTFLRSPYRMSRYPEGWVKARGWLLNQMAGAGLMGREETAEAQATPLPAIGPPIP